MPAPVPDTPPPAPAELPQTAPTPSAQVVRPHGPKVGINLTAVNDWNTELPFVDVFRMSRPWISQRKGAPFGEGPQLDLDKDGWVKRLEPDAWAETPLCGVERAPAGEWTVLHDGVGEIEMWGDIQGQTRSPGRVVFRVPPGGKGGFFLRLLKTDPANYVKNIRVLMPGALASHKSNPWNPTFIARWRGMACLRFMDFMETNHSKISRWSERPRPEHATFSERGVPVELLVDLANRMHIDPWFTMPHLADDEYVRNFASYVKQHLNPDLKVYIEYSNEVWNGIFAQAHYALERGRALKLGDDDYQRSMRFYAHRSVEIFRIFENVFGSKNRLVRVLATQAANTYAGEQILGYRDTAKHADAIAIAPYISFNVEAHEANEVARWSLDRLFAHIEQKEFPTTVSWIRNYKALAAKHNLKLMAYEGGQHLVGVMGGENNDQLTKLFMNANADARMGRLYQRYHRAWAEAGGDLFCHFASVGAWGKWGSWGLLQQYDDDPRRSPKFIEVMRWAKECAQPVAVPG